jgi:glycosyltransferase 2 family protein
MGYFLELCARIMFRKILKILLFFGVGATILTLLFRNLNAGFREDCRLKGIPEADCSLIDKVLYDFSTVKPAWILVVILAFTLSNLCRALRWKMLHEPLGYRISLANSLLTTLLGYFANLGLPRMGEVVRAGSLARYERIPLQKVMGTLITDRLMDFISLGFVIGLAFLFEGDTLLRFFSQQSNSGGLLQNPLVLSFFGLCFVLGLAAWIFRAKLPALPVVKKAASVLQGLWEGVRSVFRLRQPVLFLVYSVGIWAMFYLQVYFGFKAFPPTEHLGFGAALMVFVFGTLGFVIPSPGGMGTYHALAMVGLALYGIKSGDAFSYANISFFTIQIFYNVVAGVSALILLPWLNKKTQRIQQETA